MFSFHVDLDLGTLFEKLTAQIGTPPDLGIQFCFQTPGDLRVDIIKKQQLT